MIHPSLELRMISPEVGYGVFATELIPKGTITYVEDELEVRIPEAQFLSYQTPIRAILDKFSYIDAHGDRILSWDFGKYVNHSCDFNSISTGYGFEIAIRDIAAGEQLTDEYGIFNLEQPMECFCGSPKCRGMVGKEDFKKLYPEWDTLILEALPLMSEVAQPLWSLIDEETLKSLDDFQKDPSLYRSVFSLYRAPKAVGVEPAN
ncbi:MAG: SET domain-containing protein-lysine N-methyltransferase [Bacteroidetes bacterium]|nr:SET domain-containing protein-lysine N-methyltransferase [Bacteroidota bacterium]MBL0018900.1 SET domain-containing protein-lysine N-methyltransferase [Bacteroidota bacterium]